MPRKCGLCRVEGHTRKTCPTARTTEVAKERILYTPSSKPTTGKPSQDCSICWSDLKETNKVVTKCGHSYCMDCFLKHTQGTVANNKCPMCRTELFQKQKQKSYMIQVDGLNADLRDVLSARDYDFFIDLLESVPENNVEERRRIFADALRVSIAN
jgi:hypothetical protein